MGPEGGQVLASERFARLDIPPGALSEAVRIRLSPAQDAPGAMPGTSWELEPSGLSFAKPVLFSMGYDATALSSTTAQADAAVAKVHDDGHLTGHFTDFGESIATAVLSGFSRYAIYVGPPQPSGVINLRAEHEARVTTLRWALARPQAADQVVLERAGPFLAPPQESDWSPLATLRPVDGAYADNGPFTPEAIYWYRVRAISGPHQGVPQAIFVGTFNDRPAQPLGFTAEEVGLDVDLRWDPLAVAGVTHFALSIEVDGVPSPPQRLPNTMQSLRLFGLAPGHSYRLVLSAMRGLEALAREDVYLNRPGFFIEVQPRLVAVTAGQVAQTQLNIRRNGNFTAPLDLRMRAAVGTLSGISGTFQENPSTGSNVGLDITVAPEVPPGRKNLILEAEGGGLRSSVAFYLDVAPSSGFDLVVTPEVINTRSGQGPSYRIEVRRYGGFSDPISLSWVNLPDFLRFSQPPYEGGGYFIIEEVDPGTYPLTLRGVGGGLTREVEIQIVVDGVPEVPWVLIRNRYQQYLELHWGEVPSATGYVVRAAGQDVAEVPMGVTTYTLQAPDALSRVYEIVVQRGAERSRGRARNFAWEDPATTHVFDLFNRCRPAGVRCEPAVEIDFAGDSDMTGTFQTPTSVCLLTQVEVAVDGQVEATSAVIGPGQRSDPFPLRPASGQRRYAFVGIGAPGFGCADAVGTLRSFEGTVRIEF